MHHDEAARPVRVLGHARRDASLPEQRGLLIAGDSRDRDPVLGLAYDFTRAHNSRQDRARNVDDAQQLVVPFAAMDVEEQRARRIRDVGDVHAAAGELPDEPRVDRSECETFRIDVRVIEKPANLRRRKIRIEDESRTFAEQLLVTLRTQRFAKRRGAAVLPDDRVRDRFAGLAIPEDRRFALIRDPDRSHLRMRHLRPRLGRNLHL